MLTPYSTTVSNYSSGLLIMIRDNIQIFNCLFCLLWLAAGGKIVFYNWKLIYLFFFFHQPHLSCILLLASQSISFPMRSVMIVLESHITNLNGSLAGVCGLVQSIAFEKLNFCALTTT